MIHLLTCQICILGSVVRALRFISERLPVLIQTVCFAHVAKARQHFLNLRNPNHLFLRAIIDCLREAKSFFLQIECANESSFAKTILVHRIAWSHRVKLFQAADCSVDSMRVESLHVRNTPGKGSFLRECVVIKSSPIGHRSVIAASVRLRLSLSKRNGCC